MNTTQIVESLLTERHFVATVTGKGGYYRWAAVRDDGMKFSSSLSYTTPREAEASAQKNLGKMGTVDVKHVNENVTEADGFTCQECGKKLPATARKCSKCGSTDLDVSK